MRGSAEGLSYAAVLASARPDALPAPGRLGWNEIVRVDVRGRELRKGTIVGAAVLGTALGALGVISGSILGSEGPVTTQDRLALGGIGTLTGGIVGGGLGARVGALVPGWHKVHSARTTGGPRP